MPALILAALVSVGPSSAPDLNLLPGAGSDVVRLTPAALVAVELGSGVLAGSLAMPAVYLVSFVLGGLTEGPSINLIPMLMGTLLLPPTAVAGVVWAIAWLDPIRAPRFAPTVAVAGAAWGVVLLAGSIWHQSVWDFARLLTAGIVQTPGAALPWLLGSAALLTTAATVAVNLTTVRRLEPGPWQRPRDPVPEDPFARARPAPPPAEPSTDGLVVPLWAGRF